MSTSSLSVLQLCCPANSLLLRRLSEEGGGPDLFLVVEEGRDSHVVQSGQDEGVVVGLRKFI